MIPWEKTQKALRTVRQIKRKSTIPSSLAKNWKPAVYLPGEGRRKFHKQIIKNKMRAWYSASAFVKVRGWRRRWNTQLSFLLSFKEWMKNYSAQQENHMQYHSENILFPLKASCSTLDFTFSFLRDYRSLHFYISEFTTLWFRSTNNFINITQSIREKKNRADSRPST